MKPNAPTVTSPPAAAREGGTLVIVTRNKPGLYEYVKRLLARYPRIQVLLDRRRAERRERISSIGVERRCTERRARQSVNDELRARGWAMARRRAAASARRPTPDG